MAKCRICGKEEGNNLRYGVCFACAEAESIIADGVDMYDEGPKEYLKPVKTPLEKLQFLIAKGWVRQLKNKEKE